MTQRKLAAVSGVSRVSIARYETGQVSPTIRVLSRLAEALGVSIKDLVERKGA